MTNGSKRTVGRPRAKTKGAQGPAREAILQVAARLFGEKGFAGTSTREIAEQVGIRQPSLFYHFKKKEDILQSIIDETASVWGDFLPAFEKRSGRAAVKLYELMRFDFHYLMTEPYGIGQLIALPEMRSGKFGEEVELRRNRIIGAYRKLIKKGIAEGDFISSDVHVTTHTVFGMGEATWAWYRPTRTKTPAKTSEQIADLAIRSILKRPSSLESIKKAATAKM